jgi:hypothetical protein
MLARQTLNRELPLTAPGDRRGRIPPVDADILAIIRRDRE